MNDRVGLVDYGSGNVGSVRNALDYIGANVRLVRAGDDLDEVDRIVLPGVGAFPAAMEKLRRAGLLEPLTNNVLQQGKPYLGICVGMQILATVGEEFGPCPGLGWIPGRVREINVRDVALPLPHMGWNDLRITQAFPIADNLDGEYFYFVHSFMFEAKQNSDVWAVTEYGETIAAAVGRDNIVGVQFHPEKSQHAGLALLRQFLRWDPTVHPNDHRLAACLEER